MKRRSLLLWFVLIMFAFALASGGCGGGGGSSSGYTPDVPVTPTPTPTPDETDEPEEPVVPAPTPIQTPELDFDIEDDEHVTYDNVIMNENVYVVKVPVAYDKTSDTIRINQDAPIFIGDTEDTVSPADLAAGDILIVAPYDSNMSGFQRVIKSIYQQGNVYVIESEQASLSEIFEDLDFSMEIVYDDRFIDEENAKAIARNAYPRGDYGDPEIKFKAYSHTKEDERGYGFKVEATKGIAKLTLDVGARIKLQFNKEEGLTCTLTNTYGFGAMGGLSFDLLKFEKYGSVFKPLKLPPIAGFIPWGMKLTPKCAIDFNFEEEAKLDFAFEIPVNIKDGKMTCDFNRSAEVSVSSDDVSTFKFKVEGGYGIYVYLGVEDFLINDFDLNSGIEFSTLIPITAEILPEFTVYGALKEELTFRWINASVGKFFFDLGIGATAESKLSHEFIKVKLWPWGDSATTPPTPAPAPSTDDGVTWASVADTSWYSPYKTEFVISSDRQLAGLAKLVNETKTGTLRDSFSGKTIRLAASINLAGREWTPIGTSYSYYPHHFGGTFDGGKHTISNMTVDMESSSNTVYAGLFGYNEGTIKNVILSDFSVSSVSSSSSSSYAGGLVGLNSAGTITDCTASGSVSSYSYYYNNYLSSAGGLVGHNSGGTITDCTASGSVSSYSSSLSSAGGLVGYNSGGTIRDCTASGTDITATSERGDEYAYSGGFIGWFSSGGTLSGVNSAAMSPKIRLDDRLNPPGPSDDI